MWDFVSLCSARILAERHPGDRSGIYAKWVKARQDRLDNLVTGTRKKCVTRSSYASPARNHA